MLPSVFLVHASLYGPATLPTPGMGKKKRGYLGVGRSHDSPPNVTAPTQQWRKMKEWSRCSHWEHCIMGLQLCCTFSKSLLSIYGGTNLSHEKEGTLPGQRLKTFWWPRNTFNRFLNLNFRLINTMAGKSTAPETLHKHMFLYVTKWSKDCKHNWEPIVISFRFIVTVFPPYWYDLLKGPWK